jgi:hypothetical protein
VERSDVKGEVIEKRREGRGVKGEIDERRGVKGAV